MSSREDSNFVRLAAAILDDALELYPEFATELGDHRFDDRIYDPRPEAQTEERRILRGRLAELHAVNLDELSHNNAVDADIMGNALSNWLYELEELGERQWNPMITNPSEAIYSLLVRDFAPLGERLTALGTRLCAVPEMLAEARKGLRDMPRIHTETAITQFRGTIELLTQHVPAALAQEPSLRAHVAPALDQATAAVEEHLRWLSAALPHAHGDPRLGPARYERKLALALGTTITPDALLARAEGHLAFIEEQILTQAAHLAGVEHGSADIVRQVLNELSEQQLSSEIILDFARNSLADAIAFVEETNLVTVHEDAGLIIPTPKIRQGIAIAYCDPPGPLETAALPTFLAISPTPDDWTPERVSSYYREYNAHMTHDLIVHEGVPGHLLQLGHAHRHRGDTPIRKVLSSGTFIEGWAVYAEELMAKNGYRGPENAALRMQQLKMQLRATINTILDVRIHTRGMTESEAMKLMVHRGFQEEGEAVGKWRRALLTSTQLSTYFVGYVELSEVVDELRVTQPSHTEAQIHDSVLAYGSPPPHHLRTLLQHSGALV